MGEMWEQNESLPVLVSHDLNFIVSQTKAINIPADKREAIYSRIMHETDLMYSPQLENCDSLNLQKQFFFLDFSALNRPLSIARHFQRNCYHYTTLNIAISALNSATSYRKSTKISRKYIFFQSSFSPLNFMESIVTYKHYGY